MNITMGGPGLTFSLVRNGVPVVWKPLAKDAYDLPAWQAAPRRAVQPVSIGETYDFGVTAADTGDAALELRTRGGALVVSQPLRFVR
jgi:hypothetical protein